MSVSNFSERGSLPTFLVVMLAVVLIGTSVAAGYFLGGYFGRGDNKQTNDENVGVDNIQNPDNSLLPTDITVNNPRTPTSTTINIPITLEGDVVKLPGLSFDLAPYRVLSGDLNSSTPHQYVSLSSSIADKIQWIGFYSIGKLGFFDVEHVNVTGETLEGYSSLVATAYYVGGYFEHDSKNGLIIFADVDCLDCMGGGASPYSMFILYDNQIVLPEKLMYSEKIGTFFSNLASPLDHIVGSRVSVDRGFAIPYLEFPNTLYVKGNKLEFVSAESAGEYSGKLSKDEDIWQKMNKIGTDPIFGDIYLGTGVDTQAGFYQYFYILGRDHRIRTYEYKPFFVDKDGLVDVAYQDGVTIKDYHYTHSVGCGQSAIYAVLPDQIDVAKDLAKVGKTASGVELFGLKDSSHRLLRDFYDTIYFPVEGEKISYEDFIKARPAVFWIDPFGRVIMFQSNKFVPAAECGKPVIYLYPTKDTKVKVDLQVEKFSYTEPEYGDGWEVLARPNGELINLSDGKIYPYLFWEGTGVGKQPDAKEGFVVAREGVNKFLNEKLPQLGLQGKEVSDFIEFWQPRMTGAPYYFVAFYGTGVMNQIAPLGVSPKPDTVIRVLMDYKPLEKSIIVKEQKLSHPPRVGFTVIEWGGVLGRE
jgi:hypothetical protein